jgi:hypothetical protein
MDSKVSGLLALKIARKFRLARLWFVNSPVGRLGLKCGGDTDANRFERRWENRKWVAPSES